MSQKAGEALIWIIIIVVNLLFLSGGHGGRGMDYIEEQHYESR